MGDKRKTEQNVKQVTLLRVQFLMASVFHGVIAMKYFMQIWVATDDCL